jgi:hypothetical protein
MDRVLFVVGVVAATAESAHDEMIRGLGFEALTSCVVQLDPGPSWQPGPR